MTAIRLFRIGLLAIILAGAPGIVHAAELEATVLKVEGDRITLKLTGDQAPAISDSVSFSKKHPVLGIISLGGGTIAAVKKAPEITVRRTGGQGEITLDSLATIDAPRPTAIIVRKETVRRTVAAKTAIDKDLIEAAKKGDRQGALHALQRGANVNAAVGDGWTGLMWAASKGDAELVKALLKAGAIPDLENGGKRGRTALKLAADAGQVEIARLLLRHGADVNFRGSAGRAFKAQAPAVSFAAARNKSKMVSFLLENGADPELESGQGMTPLIFAASAGKIDAVNVLLKAGVLPDKPSSLGITPLMAASSGYRWQLIAYLLGAGADPNRKLGKESKKFQSDAPGMTPLMIAVQDGGEPTIALLLVGGADPSLKRADGKAAVDLLAERMKRAIRNKSVPQPLETMLKRLRDPKMAREYAMSVVVKKLEDEVEDGSILIASAALRIGVDPNAQRRGKPLFFAAIESKNQEMVELFLKHGADPNRRDKRGVSAFYRALADDQIKTAERLLRAGADPNIVPSGRHSDVLHELAEDGNTKSLTLLLKAGMKPNRRDKDGETPLHRAADQHELAAFKLLLRFGADPRIRNHDGETALELVSARRRPAFQKALR